MNQHHAKNQTSVALFGGSFDPIHSGHLAVARSAVKRFGLDRVYFIPSGVPPHKPKRHLVPFAHRMAMVALACADHEEFLPSLAEAGEDQSGHQIFYSVDTVRHFRQTLHAHEHIYFILGADQFLGIATWKDYETLLGLCDFIVANRPGFRIEALRLVIPPELLGRRGAEASHEDSDTILLRRTAVHPLTTVSSHVSSTEIRRRIRNGEGISGLVPPRVEEYIEKQALYR
ncbi:MAG: nicotinate-nucleotide adenylyltransferase [Candidatus Acidiferrales bacterium]